MTAGTSNTSASGGLFDGFVRNDLSSIGGGGSGVEPSSTWQRSLSELAASNMKRSSSSMAASIGPPSAAAQALLGQRTDLSGLLLTSTTTAGSMPRQQQTSSTSNTFALNSDYGIEKSLESHCDGILNRILKKQQHQTERMLEEIVQKRRQEDWRIEREWWKKELVRNRNLVDPTINTGFSGSLLAMGNGTIGVDNRDLMMSDNLTTAANFAQSPEPKMIKDHLDIVCEIGKFPNLFQFLDKFEKLALLQGNVGGYQTAWSLLREVLPNFQSPIDGALGTLTHLCRQYQGYIRNRVKTASLKGQDITTSVYYSNRLAGNIAAFVKLTTGSNASVWDILYYCLRCGDAHAAKDVVSTTPAGQEDIAAEQAVLLHILDQISRRQENAICLFQGGVPMIGDRERSTILNFYEKTKNTEPNKLNKIGVLALLSGQQLEAVQTIEDYLFGRLWLAVQDREDPVPIIKDVGENIRTWGPSHFMTEGSGAWGYCLPLLAAQQYKTALSFLAQAGGTEGLLEAVHLGLIFSMAGVKVSDLGEGVPSGPASRDLVTVLLSKYAQILESDPSAGLTASLQYLLRIPSKKDSEDQIAALIARHPDRVDFFAGTLDSLLSRQHSELDKFLPPNEVASILNTAADIFKEQSADFNKAQLSAKLLMLAHRYSKLTELLITMITPTDVFDNEKIFWNEQSQSFYDAHLSRRSVVVEHLESCHKMNLAYTLNTLLALRRFFDFRRQGKFEEAFSVVAATELLPLRQDQLDANQGKFKDYHPALKDAFPSVLSAAVECLYERYRRLKSESRTVTVEVEAHLRELAMCARILFLFAGLINMPGTCRNSITQMRANMI